MRFCHFLIALILLAGGTGSPVWAHSKTDIVTLYNGDKITGEFKSMYGGIAELKTDALGTVKIEWKHIAHLQSDYHYDLRLSDGTRYFGTFATSAIPGQLKAVTDEGEHNVEMLQVVEMRPIESSFLDRIDIYLSAGYSYTKASSVGQTSFNTNISYEDEKSRNVFTGRTLITDTDDDVTNSTKYDVSRAVWTDRSQSFRVFYGRYEQNDELALEGRYTAGGGLGRYFIDTQKLRWMGSAGLQILTEKSVGGDQNESVEGFLSTNFAAWRFDTPELDLDFGFNLYPSFSEQGRLRGDTDIRLRWELIEDLYLDLTAFGTYDNKAETDHEFDYGITTGVGWTY